MVQKIYTLSLTIGLGIKGATWFLIGATWFFTRGNPIFLGVVKAWLYSINNVSCWFYELRLRSSFSCLLVVPSFQVTKGFYICVYRCISKLLVFKNFWLRSSLSCLLVARSIRRQTSIFSNYVLCLKILYAYGVICLRHKLEKPCMGIMYISQRNALIVTELCIVQILRNLE